MITDTCNDAVLSDLNMVPNRRSFNNTPSADMNMITDLHRIVVEVASVGFIWRPAMKDHQLQFQCFHDSRVTHRTIHPSLIRQYLPREITTAWPGPVRLRSPRMIAVPEMIVFPPRMMFCGPAIVARRDTLLPVSYLVHR